MQAAEPDQKPVSRSDLPVRITQWNDRQSGATAWLVIDRRVNGVAGGGVFMWERATAAETADLARTMSKKFVICEPRIGGAKAGIRFAGRDPSEREEVLRRFLIEMKAELQNGWVTAGDFGTSDRLLEKIVVELSGHDMQAALYRLASKSQAAAQHLARRAPDLYGIDMSGAFTSASPKIQFGFQIPLIEAAVGYGLTTSIRDVFARLQPRRATMQRPLEGVRVAIQGAGAVGTGVALFASRLGAQIVAISDADGILYRSRGLPIEQLLAERERQLRTLPEGQRTSANKLLYRYCPPNCSANLSESNSFQGVRKVGGLAPATFEEVRKGGALTPGVDTLLAHLLTYADEVDVFVPAALRYVINEEAISLACRGMWKRSSVRVLVSGANNPFGTVGEDGLALPAGPNETEKLLRKLYDEQVVYVPDYLANGGTAQLFHCYASGELCWIFDGSHEGVPILSPADQEGTLASVSRKIERALAADMASCEPTLLDLPWRVEARVNRQFKQA